VGRQLAEQLLAQPAPIRLLVGVLAIGAGVVVWRVASLGNSAAEARPRVRAPSSFPTRVSLARWSSVIGRRLQAVLLIVLGAALTVDALGGD
jgi:hypothetical protein